MATLRKEAIAERVAAKLKGSKAAGDAALNAVIDSMQETLAKGEKIALLGFGTFEVITTKAKRIRPIRGAQAGTLITLPGGRRVRFRPGQRLKAAVAPEWYENVVNRARRLVSGVTDRIRR